MKKSVLDSKRETRQAAKTLLGSLSPAENTEKSARIAEKALSDPALGAAERILIYRAMPVEVQTQSIINRLRAAGHEVFVPVVIPKAPNLVVARWPESETAWEAGPFGIAQPRMENTEPLDPASLDLVFTPGLAFDPGGGRLGYGKGYFDRLFRKTGDTCQRIGLAFDIQVIPQVPTGPEDVAVHRIITETRSIRCSP